MRYLICYLAATDVIQTLFHQQETFIKQPCGFVPITCPFQWKSIQQGDNLSCNIFSKAVVKHTQAKNQHGTLCVASKAPRVRSFVAWEDALGFVYFNMYTHNHIHVFSTCLILPPHSMLFVSARAKMLMFTSHPWGHCACCWCAHQALGSLVKDHPGASDMDGTCGFLRTFLIQKKTNASRFLKRLFHVDMFCWKMVW